MQAGEGKRKSKMDEASQSTEHVTIWEVFTANRRS